MKNLKRENLWDNHPRCLITTTASSLAWLEWTKANRIKVVLTPVGFKELAIVMRKIEKQINPSYNQFSDIHRAYFISNIGKSNIGFNIGFANMALNNGYVIHQVDITEFKFPVFIDFPADFN